MASLIVVFRNAGRNWFSLVVVLAILLSAHSLAGSNPHAGAIESGALVVTTPVTVTRTVTVYSYHCSEITGTAIVTVDLTATPIVTVATVTPPLTRTATVAVTVTVTYGTGIWEGVSWPPGTVHVVSPITFTATITVGASNEIMELTSYVKAMGLDWGTENSLNSKLENAIKSLEKGQVNAAIGQLEAFTHQVEALRGKKLTEEQADYLADQAQAIVELLRA